MDLTDDVVRGHLVRDAQHGGYLTRIREDGQFAENDDVRVAVWRAQHLDEACGLGYAITGGLERTPVVAPSVVIIRNQQHLAGVTHVEGMMAATSL